MPSQSASAPESEPLDVHTWFSLTYANYLVLPRSVLQSMPEGWQHRFTALMREMDESFGHLEWPDYDVRALRRPVDFITHEPCPGCEGEPGERAEPCETCGDEGEVEIDGGRYETAEEVGFRTDPIPHYDRGRTRLEPQSAR